MKRVQILLFALLLFTSCTKEHASDNGVIEGTWKLVEVTDSGNPYLSQPSGDLVITFSSNGKYNGKTLVNTFWDGTFQVQDSGRITFEIPSMTKVAEEDWGRSLLTVFASCGLQSVYPCKPCYYKILGNKLYIDSPMRYDLVLEKQ